MCAQSPCDLPLNPCSVASSVSFNSPRLLPNKLFLNIVSLRVVAASLTRSGTPLRHPLPPIAASSAVPKGRTLEPGVDAVYDVSTRAAGEEQPQLEVSPITMYVTEYAER